VDPVDLVSLTRTLVDIDSTTGREGDAGRWLASFLRDRGYRVVEQPVAGDRFNIFAALDAPQVTLSTHFDCVPPFFPSRLANGRLYGRGSCDAKGILAAQVVAAERLRAAGERRVGLLFVVGEERGSDGAVAANGLAPVSRRYLVNGEPTDNRLGSATRGILRVRLTARGRAAHSSMPELGDSAIEKLVDALVRLRTLEWDDDPVLGRTHYSVGLISGGVAPNVIPAEARAEVMFRTVADAGRVRTALAALAPAVAITDVLEVPPVRLHTLDGFETAAFPFTTDIAFLTRWGTPLLIGPGSVLVAHTDEEHVALAELEEAVDRYVRIATTLLSRPTT
jgi:acetylornithine deacetylase